MEEALKAVDKALGRPIREELNAPRPIDVIAVLDKVTSLLDEAHTQVEDVRRRLSLIQKSIGGKE